MLAQARTGKKIQTWTEKDGLPCRAVVAGIAWQPKTGDVWLALFGGGRGTAQRSRFDHLDPVEQRTGQRRGLRVASRTTTCGPPPPPAPAATNGHRRVDHLHREEQPDGGDLELRRELRRWQSPPRRRGTASWSTTSPPATGRSTWTRQGNGDRSVPRRRSGPRDTTGGQLRGHVMWVSTYFGHRATTAVTAARLLQPGFGRSHGFMNNIKARQRQRGLVLHGQGPGAVMDSHPTLGCLHPRSQEEHRRRVVRPDKQVLDNRGYRASMCRPTSHFGRRGWQHV